MNRRRLTVGLSCACLAFLGAACSDSVGGNGTSGTQSLTSATSPGASTSSASVSTSARPAVGNGGASGSAAHSSSASAAPAVDAATISIKNLTQANDAVVKVEIDYTCTHAAVTYNDDLVMTLEGFAAVDFTSGNATPAFTCDGHSHVNSIAEGAWTETKVAGTTQPLDWTFLIGSKNITHGEAILNIAANKDAGTITSITNKTPAGDSHLTVGVGYSCVAGLDPTTYGSHAEITIANAAPQRAEGASPIFVCDGTSRTFSFGTNSWLKANFQGGPQQVNVQMYLDNSLVDTETASVDFTQ